MSKLYTLNQAGMTSNPVDLDPGDMNSSPPIERSYNIGVFVDGHDYPRGTWEPQYGRIMEGLGLYISSDFTGPVSLELEYEPMKALINPKHLRNREAIHLYKKILKWAKLKRPRAKFGWHGLPYGKYWEQTEEWRLNNLHNLKEITKVGDALFPSIYDSYGVFPERDDKKFGKIVELAVAMRVHDQPVLPFTSHRYHNNHLYWGAKLIDHDQYVKHSRNALKHGADGLMAFGRDPYYHQLSFARDGGGLSWVHDTPEYERFRQAFASEGYGEGAPIDVYTRKVTIPNIHAWMVEAATA